MNQNIKNQNININMNSLWTLMFAPKSLKEFIQQKTVLEIKRYVETYKTQKKRAVLIYGPSGCGKTSFVYVLAKELNLNILELNASDFRNADAINSVLGVASQQQSLFAEGRLILIDEIDGVAGKEDRGGVKAVCDIIAKSKFPVILTANNPWDSKFSSLRTKCLIFSFEASSASSTVSILKKICETANVQFEESALFSLARKNCGDIRGAIIDCQTLASCYGAILQKDTAHIDERKRSETIIDALVKVLKITDLSIAIGAFDGVEEDLDECLLWVEENIPMEYFSPKELASAFNAVSRADIFRGRINKRQHWRFISFINFFITAGVAGAKTEPKRGLMKYARSERLLKIWIANQQRAKAIAVAKKFVPYVHCSFKRVIRNVFPVFRNAKLSAEAIDSLSLQMRLNDEEKEWFEEMFMIK